MQYKPHNYQQHTTHFIETHPQAAILLGMGLGKTISTLTAANNLLARQEAHRVLVIAPVRVARDTWPVEIQKWDHLQHLTYSTAVGTPKERHQAIQADTQLVTISRDSTKWLVDNYATHWPFDMVIIDELSSFKATPPNASKHSKK